uniref:Rgp1-domain-containing protein n=1 Tax=Kwoniella bestiolae CBS 10118 TaxID=1296100 RepID=A0A1B9FS57_9TREE|nr:hypothetical protein I302_08379 [Kwoniella bestiolae CBS 10118]OCF21605.1 hypothetical protein I302_08379 [Kwoniella bestiolae CBS 10118]
MSSYFPFSSSSSSISQPANTVNLDDPHLQVTITPSASAYYAGETFSVTITFTNTRTPPIDASYPKTPVSVPPTADVRSPSSAGRQLPPFGPRDGISSIQDLPARKGQIGLNLPTIPIAYQDTNAEAGPSRLTTPLSINSTPGPPATDPGFPYSPGANPAYRAPGWPGQGSGPLSPTREKPMNFRSPDGWGNKENGAGKQGGHSRRTRSLALGKGTMSPQELVWALGGQPTPPPLPSRRPQSAAIPSHHPHSRKISITNFPLSPPSDESINQILSPPPSRPSTDGYPSTSGAGPSRPPLIRGNSSTSSIGTLTDDDAFVSNEALTRQKSRPTPSPLAHGRTPSYHNAYGASCLVLGTPPPLPPPTHPYIRERIPADRGTTTVLWAYTRLVAQFHPSNAYIPPDPLLPLRSMLLHQPVGSGSLNPTSSLSPSGSSAGSSRWQLSFGTGTIGNSTQPSLTGSLFGLAKDLVMGGSGGSLEEERKRVWNMKDLPVLETTRSLLGVDIKLKEGESKEFVYTLKLPSTLPPAHRGKAFRFSYDLIVSLNVSLPGGGGRQKSKDISIPIRVWSNVSVGHPFRTYDVLKPIIQNKEEGTVQEVDTPLFDAHSTPVPDAGNNLRRRSSASDKHRWKTGDTQESLQAYARHLLDTLEPSSPPTSNGPSPKLPPLSPGRANGRLPRSRVVSPSSSKFDIPPLPLVDQNGFKPRPRQGTLLEGDDELVEEGLEAGCGEAVEILSRHSPKASYDIAKDGEVVAVLTLIKTTYRLGETVLGVVTFNEPETEGRVLKFSAFLESHELIPQPLLPPPGNTQPSLGRLQAEHRSSYAISSSRLAFSLDIPSDATPGFSLAAGDDDGKGGLQWKVKLQFVVAVPPHNQHTSTHRRSQSAIRGEKPNTPKKGKNEAINLIPKHGMSNDNDNKFYSASTTLTPLLHTSDPPRLNGTADEKGYNGDRPLARWQEMKTELVECEVPVKVLAGNTAFVVRPSVWVI